MQLPIEAVLSDLSAALAAPGVAVLTAPPGAGKTTGVPLALVDAAWLSGRRIIMLEPRRLAARAAAARMAAVRNEPIGGTVGYRMRQDTRVGPQTRIEVVTEGVLTRMLQSDPTLEGVGLIIFDEFHERSLHADLGLALCLEARTLVRPDLRVLVMSATLETQAVAALLGGAPVVEAKGRSFEVETRYLERARSGPVEAAVSQAVRGALELHEGDVLAFLPGVAEIRRTADRLADLGTGPITVIPLYGNLSREEQDRAIVPSPPGRRKVVLSTSLAETSLTIEGVRVVIDGGLQRVPRFSARTGLTRLETVPVSRASADQRRGRAGRTAPGVCFRLWTRADDAGLIDRNPPEILGADLVPLALELAMWGARDPAALRWIDAPPPAAFAQALELLHELGALGDDGGTTAHGRKMADLPVHPRLAHMLLLTADSDRLHAAATLAAVLGERDVLRSDTGSIDPDVRLRLDALHGGARRGTFAGHRIDRAAANRVHTEARRLARLVSARAGPRRGDRNHTARDDPPAIDSAWDADAGLLLAFAYPDRIARRRPGAPGRFLLRNGRGARVDDAFPLATAPFITAAVLDGRGRDARVFLAAPLEEAVLRDAFGAQIVVEASVTWDADAARVRAVRREKLGAIVLTEGHLPDPADHEIADALIEGIRSAAPDGLQWTRDSRGVQHRLCFLHTIDPAWPDCSDAALAADLDWLRPHIAGMTSLDDLRRLDLGSLLLQRLDHTRRAAIDRLAPTHITVPSGSRIAIDYTDPDAPALAVRLQEVFGLLETPSIGGGRVPLLMRLLSPARRPVQVTRDLASFWRTTYFDVRRDLRGRYPKHHWPEDPLTAPPARGPRRKR